MALGIFYYGNGIFFMTEKEVFLLERQTVEGRIYIPTRKPSRIPMEISLGQEPEEVYLAEINKTFQFILCPEAYAYLKLNGQEMIGLCYEESCERTNLQIFKTENLEGSPLEVFRIVRNKLLS